MVRKIIDLLQPKYVINIPVVNVPLIAPIELILPHQDTCEFVRAPVVNGVLSGFVKTPIAGDIHPSNVP